MIEAAVKLPPSLHPTEKERESWMGKMISKDEKTRRRERKLEWKGESGSDRQIESDGKEGQERNLEISLIRKLRKQGEMTLIRALLNEAFTHYADGKEKREGIKMNITNEHSWGGKETRAGSEAQVRSGFVGGLRSDEILVLFPATFPPMRGPNVSGEKGFQDFWLFIFTKS